MDLDFIINFTSAVSRHLFYFPILLQGLSLYPSWQMLIMSGLEVNIQLGASKGIKAYQDYWQRMQSAQEEDLVMNDIGQGLNSLLKPGTFLLTPRALVTKNHKIPNLEIQVSILFI